MRFSELRKNETYIRWYSLIGSSIVMIILPVLIMVSTYISLCRSIPTGSTKRKTINIVLIIVCMFMTCHLPKVFLTGYELMFMGEKNEFMHSWPSWFKAMNEISTFLLVTYSALNPFAYCGKLIFTEMAKFCDRYIWR